MNENTIKCPISGHNMKLWMSMPIDPMTGKGIKYNQIYRCQECSYAEVRPRPDVSSISSFYDIPNYYTQTSKSSLKNQKLSFLDRLRIHIAWRFARGTILTAEWIDQFLGHQPKDICEFGCGSGKLLQQLHEHGHQVYGVEPDPKAQAFNKGLNIYSGTAENLPEPIASKKIDVLIMRHVLEHCLNPLTALANAYLLLRPNGYLICEVPNNLAKGLKYAGVTWQMLDIPGHLNFFTLSNLRDICTKSGFKVETVLYSQYYRQFTNAWIDTEAKIYDRIITSQDNPNPFPKKNTKIRAWKLLGLTLLASPEQKYDSIIVIAKK